MTIPDAAERALRGHLLDALQMALHGGEDYGSLHRAAKKPEGAAKAHPAMPTSSKSGEIVRGKEVTLNETNGSKRPLVAQGWDPFS